MNVRTWTATHWMMAGLFALLLLVAGDYLRVALKPPPPPVLGPYDPDFVHSEVIPDFTLPDALGKLHSLASLIRGKTLLAFIDGREPSWKLQKYCAELRRQLGPGAPPFVAVASFPPSGEAAYRRKTGLEQTILYESPAGEVFRRYRAVPAPRLYFLDDSLKLDQIGGSPAQYSLYSLGVNAASRMGFAPPTSDEPRRKARDPIELDQTDPLAAGTAPPNSAGAPAGGAQR